MLLERVQGGAPATGRHRNDQSASARVGLVGVGVDVDDVRSDAGEVPHLARLVVLQRQRRLVRAAAAVAVLRVRVRSEARSGQ